MDLLPRRVLRAAQATNVRFGAEVTAIDQDESSVTVHYRGPAGRHSVTGDYAICALPVLSAARHRGPGPALLAARSRRRSASSTTTPRPRSCSRCGSRFWEQEDGIVGGTTDDRPADPAHLLPVVLAIPNEERGTLLASYTWGQDALRWDAMDAEPGDRAGARGRGQDPPVDDDRVRGRRRLELVRRSVGARRLRAVRARAADTAAGRRSSRPRAASTSRASTRRSITRGSRARSSRASAPRARSTRLPRCSRASKSVPTGELSRRDPRRRWPRPGRASPRRTS